MELIREKKVFWLSAAILIFMLMLIGIYIVIGIESAKRHSQPDLVDDQSGGMLDDSAERQAIWEDLNQEAPEMAPEEVEEIISDLDNPTSVDMEEAERQQIAEELSIGLGE